MTSSSRILTGSTTHPCQQVGTHSENIPASPVPPLPSITDTYQAKLTCSTININNYSETERGRKRQRSGQGRRRSKVTDGKSIKIFSNPSICHKWVTDKEQPTIGIKKSNIFVSKL